MPVSLKGPSCSSSAAEVYTAQPLSGQSEDVTCGWQTCAWCQLNEGAGIRGNLADDFVRCTHAPVGAQQMQKLLVWFVVSRCDF